MKLRRLFSGLCIFVLLSAAADAAPAQTIRELVLSADRAFRSGDYAAAEISFREALAAVTSTDNLPSDRATILGSLAQVYVAQARYSEAEKLYDAVMKVVTHEPVDPKVKALILVGASSLYNQTRRWNLAAPLLEDALPLTQQAFGEQSPQAVIALKNLGIAHGLARKLPAAEKMFKRALEIQQALPDADAGETAAILSSLAGIYTMRGNSDQAEPMFIQAVELMELVAGKDHPDVAGPLRNLGEFYLGRRKHAAAEVALRRLLDINTKAFGPDSLAVALAKGHLAAALAYANKDEEARTLYLSSLSVQEKFEAGSSVEYLKTLEQFATLLRKMEDQGQAEAFEARARYVRAQMMYTVPATRLHR